MPYDRSRLMGGVVVPQSRVGNPAPVRDIRLLDGRQASDRLASIRN